MTNLLKIALGTLVQGSLNIRAEGTTAIDLDDFGRWTNLSTGNVTLGGNLTNDGIITLNANGLACGDADSIQIRSTAAAQRTWSGPGAYRLTDVDVEYQSGSAIIHAGSSTNTGNNGTNWLFDECSLMNIDSMEFEEIDIN